MAPSPDAEEVAEEVVAAPTSSAPKRRKLERSNSEIHRSIASTIDNPLADVTYMWHDRLATNMSQAHLRWVANLREFTAGLPNHTLLVGSMFTGSESVAVTLSVLCQFWQGMYGISLDVRHVFMCENNEQKQAFLLQQHEPPVLFRDAHDLGNLSAWCCVAGEAVPVLYCDLLVAGSS